MRPTNQTNLSICNLLQKATSLSMSIKSVLYVAAFGWLLSACVPVKEMIYLQPGEQAAQEVFTYDRVSYRLQTNDILDVQILSMNQDVNAMFGSGNVMNQNMQAGVQNGGDLYYMTGYTVTDSGMVELPYLGKVSVQGLTLEKAKAAIDEKVATLFKNYYLQVKLGGIRYSALGEFRSPGKKVILQNQATIFEAIAASGDLTQVARRNEIKLIRQYPDGTRIHSLNLLDQSIIGSPYYFIQPNDVIYAEPLPQKSWGIGITGAQTLGTIVSTLSTSLALTLSIISLTR
jgi:polysaccharide biosynthesis/export protein